MNATLTGIPASSVTITGSAIHVGIAVAVIAHATVNTCSVTVTLPVGSPLSENTAVWDGDSGNWRTTAVPIAGVIVTTAQRASTGASVRSNVTSPWLSALAAMSSPQPAVAAARHAKVSITKIDRVARMGLLLDDKERRPALPVDPGG